MKRVFITEYVGLSTRLETLAMGFMISDYFGHKVSLDWRDLDALNIIGADICSRGIFGRFNSLKLRSDTLNSFDQIATHRNINLRTHLGPKALLEKYYLSTAQRVKLRPDLIGTIRQTFAPYKDRPLVGVHIRRGDFPVVRQDEFDVNACEWHSAPDWWYAYVMKQIQQAIPDVAFFVSCSGSIEDFPFLRDFAVFDLPASAPQGYKKSGHESRRHPAADLFALGCCRTLIGSTCSTFTHYAANMLGDPTTVLVPPSRKIFPSNPEFGQVTMHGKGSADWLDSCRTGKAFLPLSDAKSLSETRGASVDWM